MRQQIRDIKADTDLPKLEQMIGNLLDKQRVRTSQQAHYSQKKGGSYGSSRNLKLKGKAEVNKTNPNKDKTYNYYKIKGYIANNCQKLYPKKKDAYYKGKKEGKDGNKKALTTERSFITTAIKYYVGEEAYELLTTAY